MSENAKTKMIFVRNKPWAFDQTLPVVLQRSFNNVMIQNYHYFGEKKYKIITILERKKYKIITILERRNTKLSLFWREEIQNYHYYGEIKIQTLPTNIQSIQQLQKIESRRLLTKKKKTTNIQQFRNGHVHNYVTLDNNGCLSQITCYSNVNLWTNLPF